MRKPTISFYTLGCRLNQSETAVLEQTVEIDGFKVVDFKEPADVVVINTCTVTAGGDADTRRLVYKINRLNPKTKIALIGCQAQMDKEKLLTLPNVHWVIGNSRKMELSSILQLTKDDMAPQVITSTVAKKSFTIPGIGVDRRHRRANLKIQDGCDFFCSFCVIPYARGRARSREFEDILQESQGLVSAGHKEIVLTGINIGTYKYNDFTLIDIIDALEQIEGLKRIRISSIEPTTISKKIISMMSKKKTKLCRYLHVPLQSASNVVLKLMKRKYTAEEFKEFITMADALVPKICIGTDIIVGFPGETDGEFEFSMEGLKNWPIDYAHVFSYSKRQMSRSAKDVSLQQISQRVIEERSQILRDLSSLKRRIFFESLLGITQKVLFEEKKKGEWRGLTDNYARVSVPCDYPLINEIREVNLERIHDETLMGGVLIDGK